MYIIWFVTFVPI